jgi:hypothetical protein
MQLFGVDLCKYKDVLLSKDYTRIFTVRLMDIITLLIDSYLVAYMLG